MQVLQLTFMQWLKMREDFGQGTGALGASLPLKQGRRKKLKLSPNPILNIDRGQSYQGTKKDDGNG